MDISMERMTHSTISHGDSGPLFALLKSHIVVGECHMRRDEGEIYSTIFVE